MFGGLTFYGLSFMTFPRSVDDVCNFPAAGMREPRPVTGSKLAVHVTVPSRCPLAG